MSLIRKPHELKQKATLRAMIYGQPGLGKTTLAVSTPNPLLIDCDNGVHRIDARFVPDTVQVENYQQIVDLLANEDLSAYKTIVIDTAGKLLDFMSSYLIERDPKLRRADGSLTLQGYGGRKVLFQNFLRMVSEKGKHIVFVAHDKEEKSGDVTVVRPEVGGSSAADLMKELDVVGYMEAIGRKRTISFDPQEKFYAKNTIGMGGVIEVPNLDQLGTKNEFGTIIVNRFVERLTTRDELLAKYRELMDVVEANIEAITDANTANSVSEWAKTQTHVWDSKFQAASMIAAKCKTLGLIFDKSAGVYADPLNV